MSRKIVDLVGVKYGKLTVLEKSKERTKHGAVLWLCSCECGKTRLAIAGNLLAGTATSCGCESYETRKLHGMTKTRTFKSWESMKQRCLNVNAPDYVAYGGRGISICRKWTLSFNNFLEDMGERPEGTSLDRINVNGSYEPANCRWATRSEQQRNKTNSLIIEWQGIAQGAADWADLVELPSKVICERINAGWSPQDALTKPNRKQSK
jgi:hypothetical protein